MYELAKRPGIVEVAMHDDYVSKVRHRLGRATSERKRTEVVFLTVMLVLLALVGGYVLGSIYPYKPAAAPWADNVLKAKKKPSR